MKLGDALVDMFTRYPILRVMLGTMLICWTLAGIIRLMTI